MKGEEGNKGEPEVSVDVSGTIEVSVAEDISVRSNLSKGVSEDQDKIKLTNLVFKDLDNDDTKKLREGFANSGDKYRSGVIETKSGEYKLHAIIGQGRGSRRRKEGEPVLEDQKVFLSEGDIKKIYESIQKHNKAHPDDKRSFNYEFKDTKYNEVYASLKITESGGVEIVSGKEYFGQDFGKLNKELGVDKSVGSIDSGVTVSTSVPPKKGGGEEIEVAVQGGLSDKQKEMIVGLLQNVKKRIFGEQVDETTKNNPELKALNQMIDGFKTGATTASFQVSGFEGQNKDMVIELDHIVQTDTNAANHAEQDMRRLSGKDHHHKHNAHNKKLPKMVIRKDGITFPKVGDKAPRVEEFKKDEKEDFGKIKTVILKDKLIKDEISRIPRRESEEVKKELQTRSPSAAHGEGMGALPSPPSVLNQVGKGSGHSL
jgi:hypothetical protein